MTDLHMSHRFYQSEDGTEWLLRTWEPDYPKTICFTDTGPDRDLLLRKAESFWELYIEPKRAAKKAAKADAALTPIPATAA